MSPRSQNDAAIANKLVAFIFYFYFSLFLEGVNAQEGSFGSQRPNFIFILSDDVGFGDLACYGHPYARTPNLDRLAAEGTKFTQFNVNGNVCPHTRAGFMTSRNPSWFPNYTAQYGFKGTTTVTNLLQEAGYVTGHVGKWNIGTEPEKESIEYGIDDLRRTGSSTQDPRGREGLRFDEAIKFVEENQDRPFYLNLWIHAIHTPVAAPKDQIELFKDVDVDKNDFGIWMNEIFDRIERRGGDISKLMRVYLADIYGMDQNIGRLLDKLDELSLAEDTIVVFASDNGPATPEVSVENIGFSGGLRGGKHTFYEGGVRVPFIVRWPNGTPRGVENDSLMFGIDWLPTVCSLAGCKIPWELIEGEDMSDVFNGIVRNRRTPMFWRWINENPSNFEKRRWIRYGPWKMVQHDKELYNLDTDPNEENNVYNEETEVVNALSIAVDAWNKTLPGIHNRFPNEPIDFDPLEPVARIPLPDVDIGNDFPSTSPMVYIPPSLGTVSPTHYIPPTLGTINAGGFDHTSSSEKEPGSSSDIASQPIVPNNTVSDASASTCDRCSVNLKSHFWMTVLIGVTLMGSIRQQSSN